MKSTWIARTKPEIRGDTSASRVSSYATRPAARTSATRSRAAIGSTLMPSDWRRVGSIVTALGTTPAALAESAAEPLPRAEVSAAVPTPSPAGRDSLPLNAIPFWLVLTRQLPETGAPSCGRTRISASQSPAIASAYSAR